MKHGAFVHDQPHAIFAGQAVWEKFQQFSINKNIRVVGSRNRSLEVRGIKGFLEPIVGNERVHMHLMSAAFQMRGSFDNSVFKNLGQLTDSRVRFVFLGDQRDVRHFLFADALQKIGVLCSINLRNSVFIENFNIVIVAFPFSFIGSTEKRNCGLIAVISDSVEGQFSPDQFFNHLASLVPDPSTSGIEITLPNLATRF